MRRNWIKLYVDQCLRGTMMDEMKDPGERFVWFGILLLTGDSPYEGKIALTEDMGYSDEQLGSLLKCKANIVRSAKEKMMKHEKIKVLENNVIQILNWKKYQSEYDRQKKYRQSSPEWKMNYSMGTAIYNALKGKKNGMGWEKIVGYTRKDLVKHLESLFQKGMNWNNYGEGWHIDHIVPRSSFNFSDQNDSEFQRCWSMENLQPLWKEINLAKSNKMGLHTRVTTGGDDIERERDIDKIEIRKEEDNNTYTEEFSQFWDYYNFKVAKQDALKAFKALRRKGVTQEQIMEAARGYFNHLKNEKVHSNFEKSQKYPAGFLRNEYWKDFIGVKYNPPM